MVKAISVSRAQLLKTGLSAASSTVQPGDTVRARCGRTGIYRGMLGAIVCVDWSAS